MENFAPGECLYVILGVRPDATVRQIRVAYKKKCLQHHPDKQTTDVNRKKAHDIMAKINNCYEVLSCNEKRREYDRKRREYDRSRQNRSQSSSRGGQGTRRNKNESSSNSHGWRHEYNSGPFGGSSGAGASNRNQRSHNTSGAYGSSNGFGGGFNQGSSSSSSGRYSTSGAYGSGFGSSNNQGSSSSSSGAYGRSQGFGSGFSGNYNGFSGRGSGRNQGHHSTSGAYDNDFGTGSNQQSSHSTSGTYGGSTGSTSNQDNTFGGNNASSNQRNYSSRRSHTGSDGFGNESYGSSNSRSRQERRSNGSAPKGPGSESDASNDSKNGSRHGSNSRPNNGQQRVFGKCQDGRHCLRCISQGKFCYQHVFQDPNFDWDDFQRGTKASSGESSSKEKPRASTTHESTSNEGRKIFGRNRNGEPCRRCLQAGRYCFQHEYQQTGPRNSSRQQQDQKKHRTSQEGQGANCKTFGVNKNGEYCKRCINQNKFCFMHVDQMK